MEEYVLTFGKHKDKSLHSVRECDPQYISWLANSGFGTTVPELKSLTHSKMTSLFSQDLIISKSVFHYNNNTLHISASSYHSRNLEAPFRAIFGPESSATETANQWTTGAQSYTNNGQFTGTYSCCNTTVDGETVQGEWLQVESSVPHIVRAISIMANYLNPMRAPGAFVLAGSIDSVAWTALCCESEIGSWAPKQIRIFGVAKELPMTHFRLIVTDTAGNDGWLTIDKLNFF